MDVSIDYLFELSNQMADYVARNEEGFTRFLKTASYCRNFTVSNQLLIQSYLYSINGRIAEKVNDAETWNSYGISVKADAAAIYVMEHDPKQHKVYKPRAVYDISQTDAASTAASYDKGFLVESLLMSAPCPVEYTDNLKIKGTRAYFRPDTGKIEVTKGFKSYDEMYVNLAMEYAHCGIYNQLAKETETGSKSPGTSYVYPRAVYSATAYASSFVSAHAYGIDTSGFRFTHAPESFKGMKVKEIKNELDTIVKSAHEITKGLDRQLERIYGNERGNV